MMLAGKARKRKEKNASVNSNANTTNGHTNTGLVWKMNNNMRTALFYLFALMTTWFVFCLLTFMYFTSTSEIYDDHRHRMQKTVDTDKAHGTLGKHGSDNAVDIPNPDQVVDLPNPDRGVDISNPEQGMDISNPDQGADIPDPSLVSSIHGTILDTSHDPNPISTPQVDTQTCWGLCPQSSTQSQLDHVVLIVQKYLRHKNVSINPLAFPHIEVPPKFMQSLPKINKASLPHSGHQPRLVLHLDNGSRLIFKPALSDNESIQLSPKKDACKIMGQHSSELAAYYLNLLIPIVNVPKITGFSLNLSEIWPLRDRFFIEHSWIEGNDGRLCFKGTCRYCRKAICADQSGLLDGAISIWLPSASFSRLDNPWSEACPKRGTELWRDHGDFCHNRTLQSEFPFFNSSQDPRIGLLRLIDMSIFDYLIDYPDRHALYYANTSGFILLDNGKGFVDADHSDMAILAPLFQCCRLDTTTWTLLTKWSTAEKTLHRIDSDGQHYISRLEAEYRRIMATDRLYPFIDDRHTKAIERRLRKVLAVIELCIEKYGSDTVFAH